MYPAQSFPGRGVPGLPANFGWLRRGIGLAALGYTAVVVARYVIMGGITSMQDLELATALASAVAYCTFARWPRASGLLAIAVVWCELTLTLYLMAAPEVTSMLVYPVLVLSLGLILGDRWAVGGAVLTGLTIPVAIYAGRHFQGISADPAGTVTGIVMVEIILLSAGLFARAVVAAFRQLLAQSERLRSRYTRLFQDMPDGLLEIDPAGRIVEANAAAGRLFAAAAPLMRQSLDDVLARCECRTVLQPREIRAGLPVVLPVGLQRYEVTVGTPPDALGSVLLVVRDVTTRQQLMEKQALMQRLETVGQLAGGIAHEFNNLLTAIGGNAGLLKIHPDAEVQRFASQIIVAQQRAATMTRQMQAFARHDFHQPEIISLGAELVEWGELLRHLVGAHCRIEIKGGGVAWVRADQVQFEQIVVNLVKNARDASLAGGLIEVRLGRLPRAEAQRLGSTLEVAWQVMLEVADRGSGMTAEVKGRLFEPFFTTKPTGQGTGLGLSAVHGLVLQNGGAIEFESEVGRGTTARVFLPEIAEGARPASVSPLPTAASLRRVVVLVDDDATACRTAVFALEEQDFEVIVVSSGFEALKIFRRSATEVHLVIASVALPVLSGRELGERLRKLHPELPILYVCGPFDLPAGWPAEDPKYPLLVKPFRAEELVARVRALLPATGR